MTQYRADSRKENISASDRRTKAIQVFFDESQTVAERLAAFDLAGTFNAKKDVNAALSIMRDMKEKDEIRAAALEGVVHELKNNEKLIDEVLSIIKDKASPIELRRAALTIAQINTFTSTLFMAKMGDYKEALRAVLDDKDKYLRETAMEYLALQSDDYLQRLLVEGLNEPDKAITKPEIAIQLLSYDLHADHFPLLRQLAENPPNLRAKKEALRNLAADSDSKDLLIKTMEDKSEDPEIRHVCAVALQSLNSEAVTPLAKGIILDEDEDDELKAALLNTLAHVDDPRRLEQDVDFEKGLENVQNKSENFQKVYAQYKNDIDQHKA